MAYTQGCRHYDEDTVMKCVEEREWGCKSESWTGTGIELSLCKPLVAPVASDMATGAWKTPRVSELRVQTHAPVKQLCNTRGMHP